MPEMLKAFGGEDPAEIFITSQAEPCSRWRGRQCSCHEHRRGWREVRAVVEVFRSGDGGSRPIPDITPRDAAAVREYRGDLRRQNGCDDGLACARQDDQGLALGHSRSIIAIVVLDQLSKAMGAGDAGIPGAGLPGAGAAPCGRIEVSLGARFLDDVESGGSALGLHAG